MTSFKVLTRTDGQTEGRADGRTDGGRAGGQQGEAVVVGRRRGRRLPCRRCPGPGQPTDRHRRDPAAVMAGRLS